MRQGVGLVAYGQKDPKQEFKKEAFSLFEQLLNEINFEITRVLMLVQVKNQSDTESHVKNNNESKRFNKDSISGSSDQKVGRNDICPCGSQKKYKHCHGRLK